MQLFTYAACLTLMTARDLKITRAEAGHGLDPPPQPLGLALFKML